MKVRVSACQILTFGDVQESSDKVLHWIGKAAQDRVDVVVFPEACLCGYQVDEKYWEDAKPEDFIQAEDRIVAASKKYDIAVVLGTAHWEHGKLFNSLLIIDRGGIVRGRYSKIHLAEAWPEPGKVLPVHKLAGQNSCFIVCHDVRYPELVRLPAIAGARICYFCSNEAGMTSEFKFSAYRAMPISRATENDIFLVMANAPANPNDVASNSQSHGNSKIVSPDGNVLIEAGHFDECLVTATIDTDQAGRSYALRSVNDNTILADWMREGGKLVHGPDQDLESN